MNRGLLILNIVLLLLIGVLFYLHFSAKQKSVVAPKKVEVASSTDNGFRIAYFELDSVTNSFAMVKDIEKELNREEQKMNAEMNQWQKRYNDKLAQYQSMAQKQQMSEIQSETANRDMLQLQETIRNKKQELDQRYQDMYMRRKREVNTSIEAFLKEYNKTKGYSYIFSNEAGFMYYRDSAYNITKDLLKGLNAQYSKKK